MGSCMTPAEQMWRAEMIFSQFEMDLHEVCEHFAIPYQDWTHDHYDSSLELYGFIPGYVLSEDQQRALFRFGFWQVWTHTAQRHDPEDEEHHYSQRELGIA